MATRLESLRGSSLTTSGHHLRDFHSLCDHFLPVPVILLLITVSNSKLAWSVTHFADRTTISHLRSIQHQRSTMQEWVRLLWSWFNQWILWSLNLAIGHNGEKQTSFHFPLSHSTGKNNTQGIKPVYSWLLNVMVEVFIATTQV